VRSTALDSAFVDAFLAAVAPALAGVMGLAGGVCAANATAMTAKSAIENRFI
jgi:hypothetical protein